MGDEELQRFHRLIDAQIEGSLIKGFPTARGLGMNNLTITLLAFSDVFGRDFIRKEVEVVLVSRVTRGKDTLTMEELFDGIY